MLACVALAVCVGVALRLAFLDRLPGINGDEAWYGVNVGELLAGNPTFFQTPSGNLVNLVHTLPLLLIATVTAPSFAVLRLPEVLWGTLTVVLAYPLLKRPLGVRTAALTTMLLALSPTAVIYARFGWDPSGVPIVSLLALASALADRPIAAAVLAAVAIHVHPTAIFLVPMAAAAWAPHAWRRFAAAASQKQRRLQLALLGALVVALPVGAALTVAVARMGRLPSIEMVTERLLTPGAWFDTALSFVRLLSGITAATYVAGPPMPMLTAATDAAAGAVVLVAAGVMTWPLRRGPVPPGAWLTLGVLASALLFHVVAGPVALEPGLERYAMAFVVPLAIVCASAMDALLGSPRAAAAGGAVAIVVTVASSIAVLGAGYFHPLLTRGGAAHQTFRTGIVEPKAAAYRFVQGDSRHARVTVVFAEDWWIYWPVRYLARPERGRIFVEMIGQTPPLYPRGVSPPPYPAAPDKIYAIVFDRSAAWLQLHDRGRIVFSAADPTGQPILHVIAFPSGERLPVSNGRIVGGT